MESGTAALLGAVVGGFLTLAATLFVELRRDRRQQMSSLRLVEAEFLRAMVELGGLTDRGEVEGDWFEGPHPRLSPRAWREDAHHLVGVLHPEVFREVDYLATQLEIGSEFGMTRTEAKHRFDDLERAVMIVQPLSRIRWVDRHTWRL